MSTDISDAFIKQFESDVHMAYQRKGSLLRSLVRSKSNVNGSSTTFQKVGKGEATTKTRHGNVPVMNIDHTPVECTLTDHYAGDYIDQLDEIRINIDERLIQAQTAAYALGRKTDSLIIVAAETTALSVASGATGLGRTKIETVFETFGNNDVPEDGERYFPVSHAGWDDLLNIDQFVRMDYIGSDNLPLPMRGRMAKPWLSFLFFTHTGLTKAGATRTSLAWHRSGVGHASGADVSVRIDYVPEKAAHLALGKMAQGACLIDGTGVHKVAYDE